MKVAGIVAEYNPFHTGHAYQIAQTRAQLGDDSAVIAVMSGNWVQQADSAVADKWLRARLALMGGADLVLELPTLWAASGAESFARGAVTLLDAAGIVDALSFGSECGNVDALQQVAAVLDSPRYEEEVRRLTDSGMTFAACRQAAVAAVLDESRAQLLATPNNNLGVEYIRALNALHSSIRPMTVRRMGAAHNSISPAAGEIGAPPHISATEIRAALFAGNWDKAAAYMPGDSHLLLQGNTVAAPRLAAAQRAVLARLRTMTAEDWAKLPESGAAEGLPRRLEQAGRQCTDLEHFYELAKTKRYTHARLRRLVLWAYLGITEQDRPETPPYLRVLGFNERGQRLLKEMKRTASLPIITKPAQVNALDASARKLFALEARCTDLYDLCFDTVPAPGREWTTGPVILTP